MRVAWTIMALAGAFAAPGALCAETRDCRARLNGVEVALSYEDGPGIWSSFRERRLTRAATCPGKAVIAHMLPGLSEEERAGFCAVYEDGEYRTVALGPRDGYARCDRPSRACRMVNATKEEALRLGAVGRDLAADGVRAAKGRAGALVMSGKAGALASALGEAGGAAAAALSAPGVLAGAAASVVVVGGAVMVCG